MRKTQNRKLAMYLAVLNILRAHPELWATTPALERLIAELERITATIQHTARGRWTHTKGVTQTRDDIRERLIEKAFAVSQAIRALALERRDFELAEQFQHKFSALQYQRVIALPAQAETVLEHGRRLGADLQEFGISTEHLDALEAELVRYRDMMAAYRTALARQRTETADLRALFREAESLLAQRIDLLMIQHKGTKAYSNYRNARRTGGHRSNTGNTAEPAAGADATVTGGPGLMARYGSMLGVAG